MNINYSQVAEEIFTTLVGANFKVESFDNTGNSELDPRKASKFVSPQLVVNLDRDRNLITLDVEQAFAKHPVIKLLKNLSQNYQGLDFDYKVIGRNIKPKRESIMTAIGGSGVDLNLNEIGPALAAIGRAVTSPAGKAIATQVASKVAGAAAEYGIDKLKSKLDQQDTDADVEEARASSAQGKSKSKPRTVTQRKDLGVGVALSLVGGREVYTVFQIVYVDPNDPMEVKKGPFRTQGKYSSHAEAEAAGKKLAQERGVEFFTPRKVGQRQVTEGVFDLADLILENNDKIYAQMQNIARSIGDREEVASERRRKIFHPEEFTDQVLFSVSSDKAQYAVTSRFGDLISQDEHGHFVAPRKIWSKIEQTAYDADGVGAEEIIDEGKISKFLGAAALSAAMALPGVRAQAHDYSHAATQQQPAAVQQVNVKQEVNTEALTNLKDMVANHQVKDYASLMQAIEQSAKQAVEDVWGTRQNFDMVEQVQKNTEIQVMKIIAQQQGQKYPSGNMGEYIQQLQNWASGHQVQEMEDMDEGKLANLALAGIIGLGGISGGYMAGKHSAQAHVSPPGQNQQIQSRDPWQKVHQDAAKVVQQKIASGELNSGNAKTIIHQAVRAAVKQQLNNIKDSGPIMSAKIRAAELAVKLQFTNQTSQTSTSDSQSSGDMTMHQSREIDTFEASDPSGIFHAARHLNKSFLVKARMAEGGTKTFRVKAQSERVAREKFSQHHAQAVIQSVKEEGIAEGSITEDNKQPSLSKYEAYDRLEEIYNQITVDDFTASPEEAQGLLADAKRMYKITGSRFPRYSNTVPSAGYYYNEIYKVINGVLGQHGQREFPSAANVKDFAKGIAAYYHGNAKWQKPIRWQNSAGGSRQDPEWTVVFEPEHMDDVWQDLSKRGKTVYISGSLSKTPQTYLQFGSILVGKDASITGPFSDNPERTDFLTFQSAKILRNDYYTKHDITPQQAHQIQDIAKTKNQNAQDMVRAIARALNEPKMDKALARVLDSTRIDPAFKAKLNQIIAGAKDFNDDFKEGMAEGSGEKTPEYYEKLAKKHETDAQKGTKANIDYARRSAERARQAAAILKKGGSQAEAWRHYQGTDKNGMAEGSEVQKKFKVVYHSPKTDRNVTMMIKASNESEIWDKLHLKGIQVISVTEQGVTEGNLKEFAPYSRDDDGDSRDIDPLREKIYSRLMKKLANVKGNPQDIAMAAMEVADDIASESEFVDFTKLPKWVEMVLNKVQGMAEGAGYQAVRRTRVGNTRRSSQSEREFTGEPGTYNKEGIRIGDDGHPIIKTKAYKNWLKQQDGGKDQGVAEGFQKGDRVTITKHGAYMDPRNAQGIIHSDLLHGDGTSDAYGTKVPNGPYHKVKTRMGIMHTPVAHLKKQGVAEGTDRDRTVHISKADWHEFSDWMESEGLGISEEDGIKHRDLGDVIELAYPPHDPRKNSATSYMYASEWDVRDRDMSEGHDIEEGVQLDELVRAGIQLPGNTAIRPITQQQRDDTASALKKSRAYNRQMRDYYDSTDDDKNSTGATLTRARTMGARSSEIPLDVTSGGSKVDRAKLKNPINPDDMKSGIRRGAVAISTKNPSAWNPKFNEPVSRWDGRDPKTIPAVSKVKRAVKPTMPESLDLEEGFRDDLKKLFGVIGIAGAIGYGAWLNHLATYDTPLVHEIVRQAQAGDQDAIEDLRNISLRDTSTVEENRLLNKYGFRSEYERKSPETTMERSTPVPPPKVGFAKHGRKAKARMQRHGAHQDRFGVPAPYDEKKAKTRKNIEDYFYRKEIGETMNKQDAEEEVQLDELVRAGMATSNTHGVLRPKTQKQRDDIAGAIKKVRAYNRQNRDYHAQLDDISPEEMERKNIQARGSRSSGIDTGQQYLQRAKIDSPYYNPDMDGLAGDPKVDVAAVTNRKDKARGVGDPNFLQGERTSRWDGRDPKTIPAGSKVKKAVKPTMPESKVMEGFGHMLGSTKTSYQPLDGVKIIVRHKAPVAEEVRGSRSRNIKEIFIQRGDERFKMKEASLQAARAMARHVHSGGEVYDQIGKAINEMATEQKALANFVRFVSRSGMVNETNQEYVDLATKRVQAIRETFRKLMGSKTYANAVEHINNEVAVELTETDLDLESKFTSISCDKRVTNAVASMQAALARESAFQNAIQEAINKEDFSAIKHRLQEQDAIEFENTNARLAFQVGQLSNVSQDARLGTYLNNISKKIGEGIELEAFETKTVKLCLERAKCKGGRKKMESQDAIKESKAYAQFIEKFDIF